MAISMDITDIKDTAATYAGHRSDTAATDYP